jgi:hypothetical protein
MAKMKSFRILVLTPSFLGHGPAGRLVQPGSEIIMDLPLAAKDITAEIDGETVVVTKAGEPVYGANMEVIGPAGDDSVETVPHGLPAGAIAAGDGRWLVPVGNGVTFELWQPGDPTSDLTRAPADAFAANRAEAEASPAARFNDPSVFNHDGKDGPGGSLSDDDMRAMLKGYGVDVADDAARPELMASLAAERGRRIPNASPAPTAAEKRAAAAAKAALDAQNAGGSGSGAPAPAAGTGDTGNTSENTPPKLVRADITRELDELQVSYKPVGTKTEDLAALLAEEKAKRAGS